MKKLLCSLLLTAAITAPALATGVWGPVTNPGSMDQIEIFVVRSDGLYAGTTLGQVFRSVDHGTTWTPVGSGLESNYTPVQDMVALGDWLIMSRSGFGEYNYRAHLVDGSWSQWEPLSYQDSEIRSLSVIGNKVFGRLGGGIEYSDDYGLTWHPVTTPGPSGGASLFAEDGRLFATDQVINGGSLYRSDDLGQTWTNVTGPVTSSYLCSHILWQGRLLISVYHMGGVGSIWSSQDFGGSWQLVTTGPTSRNINGMAIAADGSLALGASGADVSGESIWLSRDLTAWTGFTGNLPSFAKPFNDLVSENGWFFKTGGSVTAYRAEQPSAAGVAEATASEIALRVNPNPVQARADLSFRLVSSASVGLEVFDARGRCVAQSTPRLYPAGPQRLEWQACDAFGHPLPGGIYFARLRIDREVRTARLVVLDR